MIPPNLLPEDETYRGIEQETDRLNSSPFKLEAACMLLGWREIAMTIIRTPGIPTAVKVQLCNESRVQLLIELRKLGKGVIRD